MVGFIAPSLTPTSGNANFRVYSVDPVTFEIVDFTVYIANLSSPHYHTAGPQWKKYYPFKSAYGSHLNPPYTAAHAELTPAFMHNITVLFESNDTIFQQYFDRKQRDWTPEGYGPCECSCKKNEICPVEECAEPVCLFGT